MLAWHCLRDSRWLMISERSSDKKSRMYNMLTLVTWFFKFFTSFPFFASCLQKYEMHQRDNFCWIWSLQQLSFHYEPFGRAFRTILGKVIKKAVVTVQADWYLLLFIHQQACKWVLQQHISMSLLWPLDIEWFEC